MPKIGWGFVKAAAAGAVWGGSAAGAPTLGLATLPGALAGGFIGGVAGASGALLKTFAQDVFARWRYDSKYANDLRNNMKSNCGIDIQ